jgi:S-adenosylmethionine:tRNA ribosyltransferase-isomerase
MVDEDTKRYQTVYARVAGSVAAPTAGLHFTPELIQRTRAAGMALVAVTLHVGIGTFRPIQVDRLADHRMHSEYGEITGHVAKRLQTTRSAGGKIIAVGTTSVRVLETAAAHAKDQSSNEWIDGWAGETDIFIKPGHQFQAVDGLLTNFHLPKSSLIVLVSALAGNKLVMKAYHEAINEQYRFYSYGDCMLIL